VPALASIAVISPLSRWGFVVLVALVVFAFFSAGFFSAAFFSLSDAAFFAGALSAAKTASVGFTRNNTTERQ
jgi:hypothetical protein